MDTFQNMGVLNNTGDSGSGELYCKDNKKLHSLNTFSVMTEIYGIPKNNLYYYRLKNNISFLYFH